MQIPEGHTGDADTLLAQGLAVAAMTATARRCPTDPKLLENIPSYIYVVRLDYNSQQGLQFDDEEKQSCLLVSYGKRTKL